MTIRPLTHADLAFVSALGISSKATWGYSEQEMSVFRTELTLSETSVQELMAAEVAVINNEIVGYFTIRRHADGVVELEHLFVAPHRFGRGIGSALLRKARVTAGSLGEPTLKVIADPNSAGFYERTGATLVGNHKSSIPGRTIPIYEILTVTGEEEQGVAGQSADRAQSK
ncbi:MAG: GNAT family N-acetyltransferase [Verrucomicrobiae bacterium]|nr:GNAT family N-acetyltransferase [Verrucomicrobiae bacterium]